MFLFPAHAISFCLIPGEKKVESSLEDATVDVSRLDLRVGHKITALQLPDTDTLYVVDVGEVSPRTVVGELAKHIPVDQVPYYTVKKI